MTYISGTNWWPEPLPSLPEQEQQILILRFVAAMTDGEIGGLVGMSRSAVQRHRTKTLNELRQRLEDNGGRNAK